MTQYAKYINETTVTYPTAEEFAGVINWQEHDAALRAKGYCPIHNDPEQRIGATPTPSKFAYTQQTETRIEPRQYEVQDYDPEGKPCGTHWEWRDTEITVDTSYITATEWTWEPIVTPDPTATYEDYDRAMEAYLYETRSARGYTDREPTDYATSSVPRWKQDAVDWVDFRDRVMVYGLEVLNKFEAGEPVPSLYEFKEELKKIEIHWTYEG